MQVMTVTFIFGNGEGGAVQERIEEMVENGSFSILDFGLMDDASQDQLELAECLGIPLDNEG